MSFHSPNISKSLLEAVAAVMAEGAAGRMLANNPKAKKDAEDAGDSTMTYRGKDEKGTYTVKKHRAKGASEYKEVGQRVYEQEAVDEAIREKGSNRMIANKGSGDANKARAAYLIQRKKADDLLARISKAVSSHDSQVTKHNHGHVSDMKNVVDSLQTLVDRLLEGTAPAGEQLDEVSDKLLHNYMRKADQASANWSHNERRAAAGDKDAAARAAKDQKRHAGIEVAKKKLAAKPNTPVKEDVEQLSEGPDAKVDGLDELIKQSIEQFKKHYGKEWSRVMHASVDRLAEGAFSDIDIDRQETKADPKRKVEYTKDFNELLAKHKGAGLNPSERKRLTRLSIILGKKLPSE